MSKRKMRLNHGRPGSPKTLQVNYRELREQYIEKVTQAKKPKETK